jgi:hypothetical protein
VRHNQARALERHHVGDAIEDVGLHAGGLCLGENLRSGRGLVGARILQFDTGIGLLERFLQRPDRLVHDQGRVPDHLAFLPGGLDQGSVGGTGGFARQKREGNQHGERHTSHGHALPPSVAHRICVAKFPMSLQALIAALEQPNEVGSRAMDGVVALQTRRKILRR